MYIPIPTIHRGYFYTVCCWSHEFNCSIQSCVMQFSGSYDHINHLSSNFSSPLPLIGEPHWHHGHHASPRQLSTSVSTMRQKKQGRDCLYVAWPLAWLGFMTWWLVLPSPVHIVQYQWNTKYPMFVLFFLYITFCYIIYVVLFDLMPSKWCLFTFGFI